jgi:hypothetical protein
MKMARKPFVAPQLKEQASLAKVTLISGGVPTYRRRKNCGPKQNRFHSYSRHHGS